MSNLSPEKQQRREEIVSAVAQHLLMEGIHNSALRALAKSVGISDRMIMYYFETKEDLISEALLLIAGELVSSLESVLPVGKVSREQIVDALRMTGRKPETVPGQKLWFEIIGLAMRDDGPYKKIAGQILDGWEEWIKDKLPRNRVHLAASILAQIEGEMMINLVRRGA